MTAAWFDKVKMCLEWDLVDRARIAKLRRSLEPDLEGLIESLGKNLVKFKGAQELMANARFVQRLYDVLRRWLMGVLDGSFDDDCLRARRDLVRDLMEVDLTFEDLVLIGSVARRKLSEQAQQALGENPQSVWATLCALEKALCLDLIAIYRGYLEAHDSDVEQALLNRFLTITGFSRTLYENLAEAREWSKAGL